MTGATLTRFFGFHVAVLPAMATAFIAIHVLLVQLHGMHVPARYEQNHRRMKFFPNFLMRDLIGWILRSACWRRWRLVSMGVGCKGGCVCSRAGRHKPEWYFLFMFQTLKYIPPKILMFDGEVIGILVFMLAGAAFFVIPFH